MADTMTAQVTPSADADGPLAPGQVMPENAPAPEELVPGQPPPSNEATSEVPEKFRNEDGSLNTEALLASYRELESKQGQQPKADEPKADDDDDGEDPDDLKVTGEVTYGKLVDDAILSAGLTPAQVNQEFVDSGEVSEGTFAALEKAGFSRDVVQQYVAGFKAQAANADTAAAQAQTQVRELYDSVGGQDAYRGMIQWAASNLSAEQITAYNEIMDSGDYAKMSMAISGLSAKHAASEGGTGKLNFGGDGGGASDVFHSAQEMSKAMSDARASRDPARIKAVEQKALRSNVFA